MVSDRFSVISRSDSVEYPAPTPNPPLPQPSRPTVLLKPTHLCDCRISCMNPSGDYRMRSLLVVNNSQPYYFRLRATVLSVFIL